MVRHPARDKEPEGKEEVNDKSEGVESPQTQIIEREINLSLINEKLNFALGLLNDIAAACDIESS